MTRLVQRLVFALAVGMAIAVPAVPATAGGGCHQRPAEAAGDEVRMTAMCMSPAILRVAPGTTVTWTNADPLTHNLYGTGWAVGDLEHGKSASHTFDTPGTYAYACTLHPGMVGAVVVGAGPEPIAAVSPSSPSSSGSGAGGAVVVGLLAVFALGGAFTAGTRMGRRRATA